MGVSKNNGTPKSSILIGFFIIFTIHFGGFPPIFGNIHILLARNIWTELPDTNPWHEGNRAMVPLPTSNQQGQQGRNGRTKSTPKIVMG